MLLSVEWISDFVDITDLSAEEIYRRFTLGTAEVEEVKKTNEHLRKIFVAQIISIRPHPEATKLNLVTVDLGKGKTIEVVCGAANVKAGLKVAYAPIGTTLPNGLCLEPKKIRGILSEGMLCSEEELGFAETSEGILELNEDAPLGQLMLDYFSCVQDIILDIDNKSLTHRPDLWGMYGHAREFATLFDKKLKNPFDQKWQEKIKSMIPQTPGPITPVFDGESAGLIYHGLCVNHVQVGPSPDWMQRRLTSVGLRPINNLVDISNYVMLELGIPNHIFDRQKIKDDVIRIHRLKQKTSFTTLDEVERELSAGDTVISDAQGPLVIGGLMGGLSSSVSDQTTSVFIEVANWKPAEVRQTGLRLGLRTDSSQRYEKGLDSLSCEKTLLRIVELIEQLCPDAQVEGRIETASVDLDKTPLKIKTSLPRISSHLGVDITEKEMRRIFEGLGMKLAGDALNLEVTVPSYRSSKDIEFEVDLFEEIGRHIGYDHIPPQSPTWGLSPAKLTPAAKLHRKLKDFLVFKGNCHEVLTRPLVGHKLLEKALWPVLNQELELQNALSVDHDRPRPSLIPSVLDSIALNQKNFDSFRLFELGRVHLTSQKDFFSEESHLIIAYFSADKSPYRELLNDTEKLLHHLFIPFDFQQPITKFENTLVPRAWSGIHPQLNLDIRIMGKPAGSVFELHPLVAKNFRIKGHAAIAVVNLTQVEKREGRSPFKYTPLPKFPAANFDCTVVADEHVLVADILNCVAKIKAKELKQVKIVDVYQLSEQQKSVTLRHVFQDPERTLPGDLIRELEDKIVTTLAQSGFPLKS